MTILGELDHVICGHIIQKAYYVDASPHYTLVLQMTLTGAQIVALHLKQLGVKHIFGIVGIPIVEVAEACIELGIKFVSFRNEQSAAYAASIYGYVTQLPGVLLVVGGPGAVHALAGVTNSISNRWPLLLLAGSAEVETRGLGSFQQMDQVSLLRSAGAKFAEQIDDLTSIGRLLEQAYRESYYGQPGTTYIDLPANIIRQKIDANADSWHEISKPASSPRSAGDPDQISLAAKLIKEAKFPLLIVGKGAAYARAEDQVREFQAKTNLGFIPTPMGKGVISDANELNLSAARSLALQEADVVLVLGARLNWILHYGAAPRFNKNVKFIQVDNVAETLQGTGLGILGDINLVTKQLSAELGEWQAPAIPTNLIEKRQSNEAKAIEVEQTSNSELKYQPVYKTIRETLAKHTDPKDVVFVCEGANTMDISRLSFPLIHPRTRLDCGTNATMGVGLGYAIAAKVADPSKLVVAIEGDSALGFSAMEIETAVRSNLPMVIIVMNNSGIYHGSDTANASVFPPTALSRDTEYHKLAISLGAEGILCKTLQEVDSAVSYAVNANKVVLINIIISLGVTKKLEFGWMK